MFPHDVGEPVTQPVGIGLTPLQLEQAKVHPSGPIDPPFPLAAGEAADRRERSRDTRQRGNQDRLCHRQCGELRSGEESSARAGQDREYAGPVVGDAPPDRPDAGFIFGVIDLLRKGVVWDAGAGHGSPPGSVHQPSARNIQYCRLTANNRAAGARRNRPLVMQQRLKSLPERHDTDRYGEKRLSYTNLSGS